MFYCCAHIIIKVIKQEKEQQKNRKGSTSLSKTTVKPNSDIVK